MKSLDHRYAEAAYSAVSQLENKSVEAKEFFRRSREFPSLVLLNGLRLTVVFYESKSKSKDNNSYKHYLELLAEALDMPCLSARSLPEDSGAYRHLARRALRASAWIKRYCEAMLDDPEGATV